MSNNQQIPDNEELDFAGEDDIVFLKNDKDQDIRFRLIMRSTFENNEYMLLEAVDADDDLVPGDRVILRAENFDEEGGCDLVTVDDDDEFERVADYFDDLLFEEEVDYDEEEGDGVDKKEKR